MKKHFFWLLLFILNGFSQETLPLFEACKETAENQTNCFYNQINDWFFANFKIPNSVSNIENLKVLCLFEVDPTGVFKVLHTDAIHQDLIQETKRVFSEIPKIEPAKYNGKPTYTKYTFTLNFPLKSSAKILFEEQNKQIKIFEKFNKTKENNEFEMVEKSYQPFQNKQFISNLNIPFSHSLYSVFDDELNQVGNNNHTASKPYSYNEVNKYYNHQEALNSIKLKKESWWGKKLFNEHTIQIQGKDYWFTVSPMLDLRVGKSSPSSQNYTYNNTRAIQIQAGLGNQFTLTTSIFESQGYFADYFNRYAQNIKPSGGNPAIIPGIGIAKEFKGDQFDFPSADANLSYTPNSFFNFQLGYSRNFIGDGYRSLLQADNNSPYPFFKINTTFWKIKYTNTFMWLKDVSQANTIDKTYATKYMANHYLSWNVSKRLNIGFFESVIWTNNNNRGFDMNFVNPVIFYRSVEFASSARSGNAMLGLTGKYKWNNQLNFYSQFLIDEFSVKDVKAGNKSWKNKFGFQLGAKYYHAFGLKNLFLQAEYNAVRPYTYSHSETITNYAHNNENIGHIWGSNFKELIGIARYVKKRLFAEAKFTYGVRGFDLDTPTNNQNYGSNIFKDYDLNRFSDQNIAIGQGNKTTILLADLNVGYILNPSTNLKVFTNFLYRNFKPTTQTSTVFNQNTIWFSIGIRSDVFNWYNDF